MSDILDESLKQFPIGKKVEETFKKLQANPFKKIIDGFVSGDAASMFNVVLEQTGLKEQLASVFTDFKADGEKILNDAFQDIKFGKLFMQAAFHMNDINLNELCTSPLSHLSMPNIEEFVSTTTEILSKIFSDDPLPKIVAEVQKKFKSNNIDFSKQISSNILSVISSAMNALTKSFINVINPILMKAVVMKISGLDDDLLSLKNKIHEASRLVVREIILETLQNVIEDNAACELAKYSQSESCSTLDQYLGAGMIDGIPQRSREEMVAV